MRRLWKLFLVLALAGGLHAGGLGDIWNTLREGAAETAGLTGLSRWADIQAIDGRGLRHVTLSYNDHKLQYSHRFQTERADDSEVPYGYEGDWRVYRGDGYVFLAANEGGKVHHVFEDGSRVPFYDLFVRHLEGQHSLPTANGDRTLDLVIDRETIAKLEGRRGNAASGSGSAATLDGRTSDRVLVYCFDTDREEQIEDADEITSLDDLADLRAGSSDFYPFTGEVGASGFDPQLKIEWLKKNKRWLHQVDIVQSTSVETLWMYAVDGVPQTRRSMSPYSFGRYRVYGSLGDPKRGNTFLAISISSMSDEEVAAASSLGSRIVNWGVGLFGND